MSTTHVSSPHPGLGSPYNLETVAYEGCKIYRAFFRTDAEKLAALLPDGVEPVEAGELLLYGAEMQMQGSAGVYGVSQEIHSYKEYGLVVPSRVKRQNGAITEGMYALGLFLDHFEYVTPGRERWGWPKKDCVSKINADHTGTSANLEFSRGEHLLAKVAVSFPQSFAQSKLPEPITLEETWLNWKIIPSVTGEGLDINQLTEATLPIMVRSYSEGTVEHLALHNGPADYLAEALPVIEPGKALYLEVDFSLSNGAVIFDYLNR